MTKQVGILNQGNRSIITLIFILLFSCTSKLDKKIEFPSITKSDLSKTIRKNLIDSITNWGENKIEPYNYSILKTWYIDSLLAFNIDTSRLICAYMYNNDDKTNHDGICFFLGEKIRNKWFFFKGAGIMIPRSMVENHPINKPLSYQQLHQIALKEVYRGYLNEKGEINEAWFTGLFEGGGWGQYPETMEDVNKLTRSDYEKRHLEKVADNWYGIKKDSSKTLPTNNTPLP